LLVTDLFRGLISSWINFGCSNTSRNLCISSQYSRMSIGFWSIF
jgi:hypothetical protein